MFMAIKTKYRDHMLNVKLFAIVSVLFLLFVSSAHAFEIKTKTPGLKVYWDNTLKYSTGFRVGSQSDTLTDTAKNPSNLNQDDGDRNFDSGLISNRVDLFSELDIIYKGWGARISGAAWYDSVYNTGNDNDSPGTANAIDVAHE